MILNKKIALSLMSVALVSALVGGATFAIFTDTASNPENTFTAGTVDINSEITTNWSANANNMAPGDTKEAVITVKNAGSLELRYDVSQSTSGALFGGATPATVAYERSTDGGATWTAFIPGDNNFVMAAGASNLIKVKVTLPSAADNSYQGATGSLTVTFSAEQTANN